MNSFNHYAYGAVGDWMYQVVAGINLDEQAPGYRRILIKPQPGGELTYAKSKLETLYGSIASAWKLDSAGKLLMEIEIPANTSAKVTLPQAKLLQVNENGKSLKQAEGIVHYEQMADGVSIELLSGKYSFAYPFS